MMQSTLSVRFVQLLVLGCAFLSNVEAKELSPFYDFNIAGSTESDVSTRNKNQNRDRHLRAGYGYVDGSYEHAHPGRYKGGEYYYDCESFYSKSAKKSSKKSHKKEKHYKSDKKCKGTTTKPKEEEEAPKPPQREYEDFLRFIMVREEAGTPSPGSFGVGDTLALNGKVYYWEDYEDNLMSNVPVGSFTTLCTGISEIGDDLLCTYEIVVGLLEDRDSNGNLRNGNAGSASTSSIAGVAAFVANGPNSASENYMIVTGTEFEFSGYSSGTMVTTEDLVNPYLYADLYLS